MGHAWHAALSHHTPSWAARLIAWTTAWRLTAPSAFYVFNQYVSGLLIDTRTICVSYGSTYYMRITYRETLPLITRQGSRSIDACISVSRCIFDCISVVVGPPNQLLALTSVRMRSSFNVGQSLYLCISEKSHKLSFTILAPCWLVVGEPSYEEYGDTQIHFIAAGSPHRTQNCRSTWPSNHTTC